MPELLTSGPARASVHVLLAHGAGAPMTSPFMESIAAALAARGYRVTRFEFAYMAGRRTEGSKRPPPKAELLIAEYAAAVAKCARSFATGQRLVIGGKSLGGRVASLIADRLHADGQIAGLACLGYPFHPPGKPDRLRTSHLEGLRCPTLIVQGDADPFGTRAEAGTYALSSAIRIHWIENAGHDLGQSARQTAGSEARLDAIADAVSGFIRTL